MEATLLKPKKMEFGLPGQQMIFTHRTTEENTEGNTTYIDFEPLNNDPDSILIVTVGWNPNTRVYNNHPIGVWYNIKKGLWGIFNQDKKVMPIGLTFNVLASCRISEDDSMDKEPLTEGIPFRI